MTAQNSRVAVHQRAVLVAAAFHDQSLCGVTLSQAQPLPKQSSAGFGERLFRTVQTAQFFLDGLGQRAIGLATCGAMTSQNSE